MTDDITKLAKRALRMSAYYYGFVPTGVEQIDKILSAVACAGKAYHHTDHWNDKTDSYEGHTGDTPIDWIQNAANEAAVAIRSYLELKEKYDKATELLKEIENQFPTADDLDGFQCFDNKMFIDEYLIEDTRKFLKEPK